MNYYFCIFSGEYIIKIFQLLHKGCTCVQAEIVLVRHPAGEWQLQNQVLVYIRRAVICTIQEVYVLIEGTSIQHFSFLAISV